MQQGKGLFDDVAQLAQTPNTRRLRLRDDRLGAAIAAGLAERFAAVFLVGERDLDAAARLSRADGDRWVAVEQVDGAADTGTFAPLVST
ncbi:hypothetical protein [Paractinoplanes toevensis]|uniref:Uncharacterized protein n=1 Tax=Paractinoplanes toevensis TaxID=571911 RepID=A0A919WCW2_9ACTN|nr:hypothetical protein Ato02nite_097220 [Actinoplanes toevensis]